LDGPGAADLELPVRNLNVFIHVQLARELRQSRRVRATFSSTVLLTPEAGIAAGFLSVHEHPRYATQRCFKLQDGFSRLKLQSPELSAKQSAAAGLFPGN
jgi:hypothetical protein